MTHTEIVPLSLNADSFELLRLFPTPVAVASVNNFSSINAVLRDVILCHRSKTDGVCRSNDGGWQSPDDFEDWSGDTGRALLAVTRRLADQLTSIQTENALLNRAPVWKVNAWANVNVLGDANHAHHHPGCYWSGVYWVDAGEGASDTKFGGEFEMQDPRGILPGFVAPSLRYAVPGCLSAGLSEFLAPKSGTLVLFPSWLVHAVRRYHGSSERISVAFNFSP